MIFSEIFPPTHPYLALHTGKSFSEALILASTNPQYDKRFPGMVFADVY